VFEGEGNNFVHRFTRGRRERDKSIKVLKGKQKGDEDTK
jgi:hypothetical protein